MTEYQLLIRCLSEQTVSEEGRRRLRTKEEGGFYLGILQNPSDPDAAFREKQGKNIRDMPPTWKRLSAETVPWTQITSMNTILIVTVSF